MKNETLNIASTDEMKQFIQSQSGKGTLYATSSEYVRDLIRHEHERLMSEKLRESVLQGYQDAIEGKVHEFSEDILNDLTRHKERNSPADV